MADVDVAGAAQEGVVEAVSGALILYAVTRHLLYDRGEHKHRYQRGPKELEDSIRQALNTRQESCPVNCCASMTITR